MVDTLLICLMLCTDLIYFLFHWNKVQQLHNVLGCFDFWAEVCNMHMLCYACYKLFFMESHN